MQNPLALLFDLDGVLVRSEEIWFRCVEEAGRQFRGRAITREEFAPTFGQGTAADVGAFGLACTPAELDAFYVENFPRYVDDVWVDPEARDTLVTLRQRGLLLGLCTNTVLPLAKKILESASISTCFDALGCADLVPHAKPAPDLLQYTCAKLGVEPAAAWMIGDSRFDRAAASAAGCRFVGFRLDGDVTVQSLRELPALLER